MRTSAATLRQPARPTLLAVRSLATTIFLLGVLGTATACAGQTDMPVEAPAFSPVARALLVRTEQNDPEALYRLGILYLSGTGVPKDERTGAVMVVAAAEAGVARAQYAAGLLYGDGRGVTRDPAAELLWMVRAAEHGDGEAQVRLGHMFRDGRLVARDGKAALFWYGKAVAQGEIEGLRAVTDLYAEGLAGLVRDEDEAWRYRLALAERGDLTAQLIVGERFETGHGVPVDIERAYYWYTIAADQGSGLAARLRDETARRMQTRQIAQVRERAAEWEPREWFQARQIAFGETGPLLLR